MNRLSSDEAIDMEDYFFGYNESTSDERKVYALIIYDIIDNKRRTQFAKYLKGFGHRIQKSCFEAVVKPKVFEKMLSQIGTYCHQEDSIRVYRIPGRSQVRHWGMQISEDEEDVVIL